MKVLVTGVGGQLGHDVMNELARRGHQGVGSDIAPVYSGIADGSAVTEMPYVPMDITNDAQVRQVMDDVRPDAVIHCAAWTAVDLAEDADKQPKVRAINVDGTAHLAAACKAQDCKMMYISTDYVFNGQGQTPWQPDCKDYQPLNYYGETKLGGELAVSSALEKYFIVRIAWVFGLNGKNFIKTMLQLGKTHDKLRVVCDQIGTPTYTLDLARLLVDMIESDKYGYYHATNEGGYISWYEFACEIFRQAGLPVQVDAVTTAEYGASKAARPFNSRLDKSKLAENGFTPLPDWKDAEPVSQGARHQSIREKRCLPSRRRFFRLNGAFHRGENAVYCQMRVFWDSSHGILLSVRQKGGGADDVRGKADAPAQAGRAQSGGAGRRIGRIPAGGFALGTGDRAA